MFFLRNFVRKYFLNIQANHDAEVTLAPDDTTARTVCASQPCADIASATHRVVCESHNGATLHSWTTHTRLSTEYRS
jgi:hypothetical protein